MTAIADRISGRSDVPRIAGAGIGWQIAPASRCRSRRRYRLRAHERIVHIEYKARPGDADYEARTRSKDGGALPSSSFGRNDEWPLGLTRSGTGTDVKKNLQERGPDDTETYRDDPRYRRSARAKPQQPNEHHGRKGQHNRSVTEVR
jgi:hypothetical protein